MSPESRFQRRLRFRLAISVGLVALLLSSSAAAQKKEQPFVPNGAAAVTGKKARPFSLRRCLELAERNYPKVHAAKAKLRRMEAQLFEARTAPFSQFKATGAIGPTPTIRGTSVYSPNSDAALTSDLGLAWQIGADGVIPLWTFGKITNLGDAAKAQVKVGVHEVQKERNDVLLLVYKAYWGLQLAQDADALASEAVRRITKYLVRLEKKVDDGDGDDIELLKLKMNRAELIARRSQAKKEAEIARSGLRFLTGVKGDLRIADEPLQQVEHRVAPLARYLTAAKLFRPEINMARAGVLAREAQVRLQRARYFPDLGIGLTARYARAPEIVDQRNPFADDQANIFAYGAGLVLKWNLDFLPQSARVRQAQAQLDEARATESFALGGVAHEVEKAYIEARDAQTRLDAWSEAEGYAKQWLVKVQQAIDVGTMEEKDIVNPSREYALKKLSRLSATYDFNVAVANLAVVTGWKQALPGRSADD